MNYTNNNGNIVSNEEILNLINDKLLIIQTQLFDSNNNDNRLKIIKALKNIRTLFIIATILFGIIMFLNFVLAYIICTIFCILGVIVISIIISHKMEHEKKLENNSNQSGKEAIILQEVRNFLQGKISSSNEIKNKLSNLTDEIIKNRNN